MLSFENLAIHERGNEQFSDEAKMKTIKQSE
jgi:hypothetical protein